MPLICPKCRKVLYAAVAVGVCLFCGNVDHDHLPDTEIAQFMAAHPAAGPGSGAYVMHAGTVRYDLTVSRIGMVATEATRQEASG